MVDWRIEGTRAVKEGQKWVLGLILLILFIHWLLPSKNSPSRISRIIEAAFKSAPTVTAPTSSPEVNVPSLGAPTVTGGQSTSVSGVTIQGEQGATDPSLAAQTSSAALGGDLFAQWTLELTGNFPTASDSIQTVKSGANEVTVSGRRLFGGNGIGTNVMQADGYFTFKDPSNPSRRLQAFSPNLQGRLLPVPKNDRAPIPLAQNVSDSLNRAVSQLSPEELNKAASKNALQSAGGGPSFWWHHVFGVG